MFTTGVLGVEEAWYPVICWTLSGFKQLCSLGASLSSLGFAILDQNNFGWNELCLKELRCHQQSAKVVLFVKWPSSKSAKLICVLSIQSFASSLCNLNL